MSNTSNESPEVQAKELVDKVNKLTDPSHTKAWQTINKELWKTEFDKRIVAFAKVSNLSESKVREVLATLGATGDDERSLKLLDSDQFLPMSDLFEAFCDSKIILKGILRMSVAELRGRRAGEVECCSSSDSDIASVLKEVVSANRAKSDWSDLELLEKYDRDEVEVAKILSTRTRGRPCIVFEESGNVNVEVSEKLVKIARRQPTAETHSVGDKEVWVFAAGKFPSKPVDASPFYPNLPLVDGYCSKSSTNWTGVSQYVRTIVYLHVHKVETTKLSQHAMKRIHDDAVRAVVGACPVNITFEPLYGKAVLIYRDLEEKGDLPKLTINPNSPIPNRVIDTGFGMTH